MRLLLKEWRLAAGLTQQELGAVFGRHHTFTHKVETGERRIDPVEFARWALACGVQPDEGMREFTRSARLR